MFVTLNEPLDPATLARVGTTPDAPQGCRSVTAPEHESIVSLLEEIGSPAFAGEVLTVSNAAGSWFEIHGTVDELDGPRYEQSLDVSASRGADEETYGHSFEFPEGPVRSGTTIDIPGDAFPAFTAVAVPPMTGLSEVTTDEADVRWRRDADAGVPVVIDVEFDDYLTLVPAGGNRGDVYTDDDAYTVESLVQAPPDVSCVTRDSGRFEYPEALGATAEDFKDAGLAVADRVLPGSDLGKTGGGHALDADGSLIDAETIGTEQGRSVRIRRVATRYEIAGDALLIVQSASDGTP